jgi:outer membrane protein TolC
MLTEGKVKQAESEMSLIEIEKKNVENAIEMEVRQTILSLEEALVRLKYQKDLQEQSGEYLKIAETSFKNGVITNMEVMDAELSLLSAKTSYLQALYDYNIAEVNYLKAIGEIGNIK